jgi:hypothetical protein
MQSLPLGEHQRQANDAFSSGQAIGTMETISGKFVQTK